jgi:biotin synthase
MPAPAQRLAGSTRLAGVNAIFYGERLLTTPNPAADRDLRLLARLGMTTAAAAPD